MLRLGIIFQLRLTCFCSVGRRIADKQQIFDSVVHSFTMLSFLISLTFKTRNSNLSHNHQSISLTTTKLTSKLSKLLTVTRFQNIYITLQ